MASNFDISIIDAWNTGAENVIDGSVDDYDFDWGSCDTPERKIPCGCGRSCLPKEKPDCGCNTSCRSCPPSQELPANNDGYTEKESAEDYPVIQL